MAEQAVETPQNNPRNEALASIAATANERVSADITPLADDFEDKAARGEDYTVQPEKKEEEQPKQPEMVTIKVDGVETQVTKEQALEAGIRALQKDRTADQRLTEATRLLNEAKARTAAPPPPPVEDAPVDIVKLVQDAPFNDEAARKLAEIVRAPKQATPKLEDFAPQIEQLVDVRLQGQRALEAFRADYKDVVDDPYLVAIFQSEEQKLMQGGDTRPPLERWKEIGDGIRKWRGVSTTLAEKAQRKETITNLPSASAKVEAPAEPKPKTASEIVEEQRRARHQKV